MSHRFIYAYWAFKVKLKVFSDYAKLLQMAAWTRRTLVATCCGCTTRQEQAFRSRAFQITPALALSFIHSRCSSPYLIAVSTGTGRSEME